jgi:hypothetical protein
VAPVGTEAGAEAIQAQAAAADAQFQAQNVFSKTGQGIESLGEQGSRDAFMADIGGGSGLAKSVGMSAMSSMEPPEAPEEMPVDDEMYYTEYDPGQTGERSGTSTEARQFAGSFKPMERIKADDYMERRNRRYAAEGGLMRLAEGGAVAGNSGASGNAMSYLMGQSPTSSGAAAPNASQAGLQYLMGQSPASAVARPAPAQPAPAPAVPTANLPGADRMYVFDAQSGQFAKNPNYVDPAIAEAAAAKAAKAAKAEEQRRNSARRNNNRGGRRAEGGEVYAEGGLMGLAKGGMKSGGFVIPADVVSMVGEGNTDAGYSRIKSMVPGATAIKGKDGGQADTVKTSIEGKQPARVAHGEMYVPPETVKRMGGAKKLYAMMDRVRQQATGSKKQIKPVSLKRAMA